MGQWADHEIAARALYEWARIVHGQGDYVQAHALASQGWDMYPGSIGGALCYKLIYEELFMSLLKSILPALAILAAIFPAGSSGGEKQTYT